MSSLEIVLLVIGVVVFVLSFIIPYKKETQSEETKELIDSEVKNIVRNEMTQIKGQVDEVVEEAVTYSMEKTERSLERISNEKIMEVNDYSNTVLNEINRNHQEVMFLYDMLNSKHNNLKDTVSKAEKTVKEVEKATKETVIDEKTEEFIVDSQEFQPLSRMKGDYSYKLESEVIFPKKDELDSILEEVNGVNKNDEILHLYKLGKSKVEIAQELQLGVGEVKLVIDLYEIVENK